MPPKIWSEQSTKWNNSEYGEMLEDTGKVPRLELSLENGKFERYRRY